ncbi:sperm-associated antigen 8-like [Babylonia areolata]|uniref:sperm-associated antigen 8-like n=1 Tax=Babylonia areolata TaxID=304850 RepID=UPI003FD22699
MADGTESDIVSTRKRQRAVEEIDPDIKLEGGITSKLQVLRHGHKALLTNDFNAKAEDRTTVRVTYTPPVLDTTRKVGSKKEMMQKMYFGQICSEINLNEDPDPKPTDFRSVKTVSYDFRFTPQRNAPTRVSTRVYTPYEKHWD